MIWHPQNTTLKTLSPAITTRQYYIPHTPYSVVPQTSTHTHTHLLLRKNRNSRSVKMTIIHISVFNISRPLRVRLSGAER